MSTLQLHNVPPDVDAALATAASARGMSKNQCAIEALRRGLALGRTERSQLIETIRHARQDVNVDIPALIREARRAADA